jgi:hypothetical protein
MRKNFTQVKLIQFIASDIISPSKLGNEFNAGK